jgi:hypothetical protein
MRKSIGARGCDRGTKLMHADARRTFAIRDAIVLIASTCVGFALARSWFNGIRSLLYDDSWESRQLYVFGLPVPILGSWTLAVLAVRLLGPRLRFRRLVVLPGFAACYVALFSMALAGLSYLLHAGKRTSGYMWDSIYLVFLTDQVTVFTAPSIASVWLVLYFEGRWCRRSSRDWVELSGISLGLAWLCLFVFVECTR